MLLEFSCSNHKSIRDEVFFSTLASKDNTYEDRNYKLNDGNSCLKASVIYGANGSGKSNFIDAISFVKNLVVSSINYQPGQGIRQTPHKLEGADKESSYRIQFIVDGIRYVFGFSLKNLLVAEEYLYYFPNNRQTKIFERSFDKYTEGNSFKGRFSACANVLKPNRLFLSCAANFSSVKEVADVFNYFNDKLVVYLPESQNNWMNYSLYQLNNNPKMKADVLTFLKELGTGIEDIVVSIDKKKLDSSEIPVFLSDKYKSILLQNNVDSITAKVVYKDFQTDLIQEESTGIKKLSAILCPIIDIITNGKVLICDEIESGLHESLFYGIVKLFIQRESNQKAQLIFSTHETGLLNLDLLRRDQIWFTELRNDDRSTDLYSLAEIKNVRKDENFEKAYISGKYGAIPMLNLNFAKIVGHGE